MSVHLPRIVVEPGRPELLARPRQARGEVDAGFVYATDAAVMKDRVRVALEAQTSQPILYPIAAIKGGGHENAARRFIDFVRSEPGQQVLAKFGFSKP